MSENTVKITAIEALTLITFLTRAKSNVDKQIAGYKSEKSVKMDRYGMSDELRSVVNPNFDLIKMKEISKDIEKDIRSLKATMSEHNASTKIMIPGDEGPEKVSIYEAFNRISMAESDLNAAHLDVMGAISTNVFKDDLPVSKEDLEFEFNSDLNDVYNELLEYIYSIKVAIAKANNKKVDVDLKSIEAGNMLSM